MEAYAFAAQTFRVTEQDYGLQTHREGVCCAAVGVEINVWHKGAGARWALPDRAASNERERDRDRETVRQRDVSFGILVSLRHCRWVRWRWMLLL